MFYLKGETEFNWLRHYGSQARWPGRQQEQWDVIENLNFTMIE